MEHTNGPHAGLFCKLSLLARNLCVIQKFSVFLVPVQGCIRVVRQNR